MANITMCINDLCEMRNDCMRYTAKPDEDHQSWMYYICKGNEWFFIPNNEDNIKDKQFQIRIDKQWHDIEPKDLKEFDVFRIIDKSGNTIIDPRGRKIYICEKVYLDSNGTWSINVY